MTLSTNWHAFQEIPGAIEALSTTWSTSYGQVHTGLDNGADKEIVNVKRQLATDRVKSLGLDHIPIEANTRPNLDFIRRYLNNVLEDNWIISKEGSSNADDMRYAACIMLDTEILAQLMQVPKDLPCNTTEHFRSPYWVNMVETKPNTNTNTKEAFRVALFGEFDLLHYWFD
ncbi:hypothetical protein FOQG_14256 [Fusarium oxysporum f. sp. raphani 54005]|uniref:Uncharacterized protein n=2 Tax=Fusarium oxysporum TaxID=5507 RepID=X0BGN2_FUSOX|nr:hypothetical protein FOQG_14256 [Fusarium oxysporum f. sp. raphani 54005]EXL75117.1 hypothetical protein FOPG_09924 [Fusarium oxysporum f. sp. conglutinans race 2 54008]KAI8409253.1 hypothetical protein FOFC_09088 [Fusarium oxysporum]